MASISLRSEENVLEPIAIVGMSCRLPGSTNSASQLWDLLCKKESVQTPKVPKNRFDIDAHFHPDLARPGSFNSLGGYFLDGALEDFDPTFFNMTPIEAMWLDPQQRKMLEVSYECLESAGLTLEDVNGTNTGVYIGCFTADYQQMSTFEPDFRHNYCATGVDVGVMSNRIGNTFNLKGPSFTINTACSSSVYAIHNACHALRERDCEAAIAGGVNLILTVDQHINTAKLGVLSDTSTCHTFDEQADGYGRAEGAGALYLKRLSNAIRDGDVIRGVIRSSSVNTNGKVEGMGITFPSVDGQERAIRTAYKRANLDPNKTAYFECHGTGTPVGDPIETRAVANAMNETRSKDKPLILGAVKANIGHSEAASGIFAVMKAALSTEHGMIPGVCGFKNLNPNIKEAEWNIKIATDLIPWPQGFDSRRASVSSFGYGGTNGHVIIESINTVCPWYRHGSPRTTASYEYENTSRPLLLTMSAHEKTTLIRNIEAHQKVAAIYHLADLAYTLNCRRSKFSQRGYAILSDDDVSESFNPNAFTFGAATTKPIEIGFVCTGQGAQWPRMGYEAMQTFPSFASTIDALDQVLSKAIDPKPSWTLRKIIEASKEESRVGEAEISQPACTAIQIAIIDLFASWGVQATVAIGHSSGEIAAAYAAGRISAPEAIIAAFLRGYAVHLAAPVGSMLAVGLGALDAEQYIPEDISGEVIIACENSPSSVTLSGTEKAIKITKSRLDEAQVFARELRTGKAYHSSQMNAVAPIYEELFKKAHAHLSDKHLQWRRPRCGMVSSVTGEDFTQEVNISYLCNNLRQRVLFDSAMATLGSSETYASVNVLIEIGPHSALGGPIKQICAVKGFSHLGYIESLTRGTDGAVALLKTAGELCNKGFSGLNFSAINNLDDFLSGPRSKKDMTPKYIPDLPPYQWDYEKTFWYEPRTVQERRRAKFERHDILGRRVFGLSHNAAAWKNQLRQRDIPWLKDHTLGDSAVFPGAGHLSLAIEAYMQLLDIDQHDLSGVEIRDVDIGKALIIPDDDDGIEIQTRLQRKASQVGGDRVWYSFAVESIEDGVWTVHSEGQIKGILTSNDSRAVEHHFEGSIVSKKLHQRTQAKRWYDSFHRVGFQYGSSFQTLHSVRANGVDRVTAARIQVQSDCGLMPQESRYILHPSTIDGCLHLVIASIHRGLHKEMSWAVVPLEIEEVKLYFPGVDDASEGQAIAWTNKQWGGRYFNHNTQLKGSSGKLLMDMKNIKSVIYDASLSAGASETPEREAYAQVAWRPFTADSGSDSEASNKSDEVLISNEPIAVISSRSSTSAVFTSLNAELGMVTAPLALSIEDANLPSAISNIDNLIVDDFNGQLLSQPSKIAFDNIKTLLTAGKSIVWLTSGVNQVTTIDGGMAQGFLRAVRSELVTCRVSLLDVDGDITTSQIMPHVIDRLSNNNTKDSGLDVEFWLQKNGSLNVPRIVSNNALNDMFFKDEAALVVPLTGKSLSGRILDNELVFTENGAEDGGKVGRLGAHTAEIQVEHSDFNMEDLKKHSDRPRIIVGKMVRAGQEVDSSLIGQQVVAYSTQLFETRILSNAFVQAESHYSGALLAATLPDLCRVVDAILVAANSKPGENVLVLPSAGQSFTQMSTKVGQVFGLNVATAPNDLEELKTILSSVAAPQIVVAGSSSALTREAWRYMPRGGRFVLTDVLIDWTPDSKPFSRNVSLITCGISALLDNKDRVAIEAVMKMSVKIFSQIQGSLNEPPHSVGIEKLQDIEEFVAANASDLKRRVLKYAYGETQIKLKTPRKQINFSETGAYLLVGCLGGLGRSLTPWMLEMGCRNFVFLSRSGTDKVEAAEVVAQLKLAGASVQVFRTDASDEKAVAAVVQNVEQQMPILGVIHAAMVLQDGMFEGLTYEKYMASVNPKMNGALSLHRALGNRPLEFFLMTSSISAVLGNPGQANYCAGNSYLDSLAWYRRSHGLAASSIALPMVLDVGVVAENADIEMSLGRKGMYGIDEREMIQAFEAGMLVGQPKGGQDAKMADAQIVLGLEPIHLAAAMVASETSDAYWSNDARLAEIRALVDSLTASSKQDQKHGGGFLDTIKDLPETQAVEAVARYIIAQCGRILMLAADSFDVQGSSISSYGVDSMIGVELRTWLFKELGLEIGFQSLLAPKMDFATLGQMVIEQTVAC